MMVVIRESPRAQISPSQSTTQWPPRSPFQALLSSPSGRRKWQDRRNERDTSPSPIKRALDKSLIPEVSSEDEDEETVQLKLQAIEARLKLKKLQKARKGGDLSSSPRKGATSRQTDFVRDGDVEVPLSPTKDRTAATQEPVSPARARLGLASTVRADTVSLKRARDGTQLPRAHSSRSEGRSEEAKPTSFSERLARSKVQAQDAREREERIEKGRSKGFGGAKQVVDTPTANGRISSPPSLAHEVLSATRTDAGLARTAFTRTSRHESKQGPRTDGLFTPQPPPSPTKPTTNITTSSDAFIDDTTSEDTSGFDPFTEFHLSKRHIPHPSVAREMSDKEIYPLPRLLKEIKAPHYDPPDCESDFVVFAILASKSEPFDQKASHKTSDANKPQEDAEEARRKFMVLHLTDLKWEVDCFLFGTAFDQFWKLTPGTLIAILNPAILPPKGNKDSGRFSLKLGSSEDCVMEVGIARDLGYCGAVRKDGQGCESWVDKRKNDICSFHLELLIEKERKNRMEVNTMWRSHEGRENNRAKGQSRNAGGFDKDIKGGKGGTYHREYGRLYSVPSGVGGRNSMANLLDAEHRPHDRESEEASRKRIAAAQRERDLAKRLGQIGKGVGAEYLRSSTNTTTTGTSSKESKAMFEKPSAAELGLLANKATSQHLSPAKDRKRHFGLGAVSTTHGSEAMGWGGAGKSGLLQPKNDRLGSPEKGQTRLDAGSVPRRGIVRDRSVDGSRNGSVSPAKKKARFNLESKGIREPGRESLGVERLDGACGDDDDELDIV